MRRTEISEDTTSWYEARRFGRFWTSLTVYRTRNRYTTEKWSIAPQVTYVRKSRS